MNKIILLLFLPLISFSQGILTVKEVQKQSLSFEDNKFFSRCLKGRF
jgi:hypothetical protein